MTGKQRTPGGNKKYMTIAVSVVCERRFSAQTLVVRGRTEARKFATAYISERYMVIKPIEKKTAGTAGTCPRS